jgi:hypothetical protein
MTGCEAIVRVGRGAASAWRQWRIHRQSSAVLYVHTVSQGLMVSQCRSAAFITMVN